MSFIYIIYYLCYVLMSCNMVISGIYKIQSIIKPERIYIGSACNINKRFTEHKWYLKNKRHDSRKLQYHFDKYGINDLVFSIIEECPKEKLIELEQIYIDKLPHWFNICEIAGSCLGKKVTEETRQKFIKAWDKRRLIPISDETRKKMSDSLKGKPHAWNKGIPRSDKTKLKLSIKNKGQKRSSEVKNKMSIIAKSHNIKRFGKDNFFYGKIHSKLAKSKMSIAHKNMSDETRQKMSDVKKGKLMSEETKAKMSKSQMGHIGYWNGKKRSEETRQKMKDSHKKKYNE